MSSILDKTASVALAVGKKKGVERDGCSRNFFNYHVFVYHIALSATLALYTQEKHIEPTEAEVALYARKLADDFWGKWLRS